MGNSASFNIFFSRSCSQQVVQTMLSSCWFEKMRCCSGYHSAIAANFVFGC